MTLVLLVLAAGVVGGFAAGGRLSNLPDRRLRWPALLPLGFALQLLPVHGATAAPFALVVSLAVLVVFAAANLRLPPLWPVTIGLALNLLVVAANAGMPVSGQAVARSGQSVADLAGTSIATHHLADGYDVLRPLGDVIPLGPPIRAVVSGGDVLVYAGTAWLVAASMRPRRRTVATSRAVATAAGAAA